MKSLLLKSKIFAAIIFATLLTGCVATTTQPGAKTTGTQGVDPLTQALGAAVGTYVAAATGANTQQKTTNTSSAKKKISTSGKKTTAKSKSLKKRPSSSAKKKSSLRKPSGLASKKTSSRKKGSFARKQSSWDSARRAPARSKFQIGDEALLEWEGKLWTVQIIGSDSQSYEVEYYCKGQVETVPEDYLHEFVWGFGDAVWARYTGDDEYFGVVAEAVISNVYGDDTYEVTWVDNDSTWDVQTVDIIAQGHGNNTSHDIRNDC